jgi:protein-S-isoprenylcysteine O-methyltransferase Ste14
LAVESRLSRDERLFNVAAALSVLFWAAMGLRDAWLAGNAPTVRLCIVALHLCVASLFLFRTPLKASGGRRQILLAVVSFLGGAVPFALAPPPHTWPTYAQIPFAAGIILAILSLIYLGRSFAILPALREIVVRGPYRIVRHPAYAGELIAVTSCFIAHIWWASALAFLVSGTALVVRIRIEESLLERACEYQVYSGKVRFRLIPGVW